MDTLNYLNNGHGLASWLLTKDHKRIALLYLISITIMFALGGLFDARGEFSQSAQWYGRAVERLKDEDRRFSTGWRWRAIAVVNRRRRWRNSPRWGDASSTSSGCRPGRTWSSWSGA